jgi:hypothetical protein
MVFFPGAMQMHLADCTYEVQLHIFLKKMQTQNYLENMQLHLVGAFFLTMLT